MTHSLGASDKQIATRRLMEFTRACDTGEYDPIVRDGYEFGALPLEATINR